ncbi:MAG: pilus assembly protein PilM [Oscillospiraceae bacterium]|nr:pilus assembly protein PilM [Oscillospiraceae bacterium]
MLSFDITDKQIKLVKGSLAGSKIRINAVETRDIPEGAIVNGYVNDFAAVADLITGMTSAKKISDKDIVVCINSGSILYKELEVLKPKSLKNTATIEAMIVAQMGIATDYNVSYSVVGDGNADADGNPTIKVMATACPQRMVDGYQTLFAQAGLKLTQINISNNCITRLIMNTPKLKDAMPFLCIQVDSDFVNINLYEDGQVSISRYIKIDPADYEDNPDYVNIAVFDNLFRMIQFIGQRPGAKPLKQIMFYGIIKDFVALSNSISSFNVPAHVLTMPNNIVKFCEVDFSKYANAIGAFYKVDPIMEHVNLLQSVAVKSKQGGGMFPVNLLLTAGITAGLVFGVYMIIGRVNNNLVNQTNQVNELIRAGDYEAKRMEMELMQDVLGNFSNYKYAVKLAQVMFDFLPRGDLPQISTQLLDAVRVVGENPELGGAFHAISDVSWSGYDLRMTVYCGDTVFPADYVDALNQLGFFENITYGGFRTVSAGEVGYVSEGSVPGGGSVIAFELSMRLKGGHIFESDGRRYGAVD